MGMESPRQVPYHESLNRHNLIMGCERELILSTGVISVILIIFIQKWWSVALGVGVWLLAVAVLRRVGKVDPIMSKVLQRHFKYRDYYPAQSGLERKAAGTPLKWTSGK